MSIKYADIIIDISHEAIDRAFQYEVPFSLCHKIVIGMEVTIPFGKGNSIRKGYVVGLSDIPNFDVTKMKSIIDINENSIVIESHLIKLAVWIKENYGSTMINALKTVMPVKEKIRKLEDKTVRLLLDDEEAKTKALLYQKKNSKAKLRLINELIVEKEIPKDIVSTKLNISPSTLNAMIGEEVIAIDSVRVYRKPSSFSEENGNNHALNEVQEGIVNYFINDYENNNFKTYLLHGVTGSGKTEVYMEIIDSVIKKGKQVIVLIPEIALTYQTVMRFRRRFGDRITFINSKLSKGERYDQFLRAKKGEVDIIIGPRSALFAPFSNLGLIVIDEEHENSYKSDYPPKYHAREVAIERSKMCNASVVLGSATPSVDSFYKALKGEYTLWTMKDRVANATLPEVSIVDLREELKSGNRSVISYKLQQLISDRLEKKQQIMLFLNKRGYAGFVSCRNCGSVVKCPHCDVSLTIHNNGKLVCHYCNYEEDYSRTCKVCGTNFVGGFKPGTQKIEEEVNKLFPLANVLRMDMDTTKKKGGHDEILSKFSSGEGDILVGTQMIVKGHDFANVTLVGILLADLSLYSNDYRAGERTFDLLTQAAGRAGRGDLRGEVVIQTYNTEHYAIKAAANQDYSEFYNEEIAYRELMSYPPMSNMMVVFVTSTLEDIAEVSAKNIADYIKSLNVENIYVVGPAKATISKVSDVYRRVVYIKHFKYNELVMIKNNIETYIDKNEAYNKTIIQFDFNPMNMY